MMMQGHKNSVLELHWTADGDNLLTCSPDKTLRLWDATTGESVKCMKGHQSFVNARSVAPKGKPLCVSGCGDGTAKLWDFRRKGEVATFADRFQVTAGSACLNVFVWDFDSRRVLYKLPGHDGAVNETSFHPTEPIVGSAGSDGKIFLGELAD